MVEKFTNTSNFFNSTDEFADNENNVLRGEGAIR